QTEGLVLEGGVKKVYISALFEKGMEIEENIDSSRIVKRHVFWVRKFANNFFTHLIAYIELTFQLLKYSKKIKADLVNVHTLALLPIGFLIKYFTKAKLVYDAHELETEVEGLNGVRKKISKLIESFFIRKTDLVVVVGDRINKWYKSKYDLENIVTVLNCPRLIEPENSNILRKEFKIDTETKILLYQGGLSEERGIRLLVESFKKLSGSQYALVIMGYGELEEYVVSNSKKHDNIYFRETVSPSEVIYYAKSADIGVSLIKNSCLSYEYCLPNKLFDYMMAEIPIISSNLPEMKKVISDYKIGVTVEKWTTESFLDAFLALKRLNHENIKNNLKVAAQVFNWENQELKYINAIKELV
ncbi:MAG TPA: glycosyl transferase family 1, partial [Balneola sp.]|nr:glycosyl transferase family 1 [Balneola sp.]